MMKIYYYFILYLYCSSVLLTADDGYSNKDFKVFIKGIHKEFQYFRLDFESNFSSIRNKGKNSIFEIKVKSRRNNYGEIIIMSTGILSRYLSKIMDNAIIKNSITFTPSIITIHCVSSQGRDKVILTYSINSKVLIQFGNGEISVETLWNQIKNNITSSKDFIDYDSSPKTFIADVDYENMISARIALEGKNNPRLSSILSTALKASWVPGLESKLENILVSHLKKNHSDLMRKVMGNKLEDDQMLRIGRQFFIHIQKPFLDIKKAHIMDSLKYVWKGNLYPIALDTYYIEYRKKHNS